VQEAENQSPTPSAWLTAPPLAHLRSPDAGFGTLAVWLLLGAELDFALEPDVDDGGGDPPAPTPLGLVAVPLVAISTAVSVIMVLLIATEPASKTPAGSPPSSSIK